MATTNTVMTPTYTTTRDSPESQFRSEWIIVGELDSSGLVARAARFSGDDHAGGAALLDAWAAGE